MLSLNEVTGKLDQIRRETRGNDPFWVKHLKVRDRRLKFNRVTLQFKGVPNAWRASFVRYLDLRPETYWNWRTEIEAEKESRRMFARYQRLALVVLLDTINSAIRWRRDFSSFSDLELLWKNRGNGTRIRLRAQKLGIDLSVVEKFWKDYMKERQVSGWFALLEGKIDPFLDILGKSRSDVVKVVEDLASGSRQLGYSEPDIEAILQIEDQGKEWIGVGKPNVTFL